ncbi:FmdB family zinc ribbon protein [Mycobacterium sp.]|uniref:FmdB family zinc ribbon protein n=1 Tax=Mycobacterium sp. TaxID=1785 RepID=UPI0025F99A4A|nr:FmdB family zinc ribbon protein [Mycobacterium sp.]MBW0015104.1 FmdB family transcriptional regulator [Mycobacterium sp.]
MPTYSYACTACDNRFDVVQGFSDDALTTCEKCSGRLRKLFNSVGIVFKGSGFYRTDSRDDGKKSAKPETPANGSSTSDAGSSSGSGEKNGSTHKNGSAAKSTESATPSAAPAST